MAGRIKLNMSFTDMVVELVEGNLGAADVLLEVSRAVSKPQFLELLAALDHAGCYGAQVCERFNKCGQNPRRFYAEVTGH